MSRRREARIAIGVGGGFGGSAARATDTKKRMQPRTVGVSRFVTGPPSKLAGAYPEALEKLFSLPLNNLQERPYPLL